MVILGFLEDLSCFSACNNVWVRRSARGVGPMRTGGRGKKMAVFLRTSFMDGPYLHQILHPNILYIMTFLLQNVFPYF